MSRELPDQSEVTRAFWLAHMRIGFGVFLGEALFVMLYLGITPHGPHRAILWAMAASWFVLGAANLLFAPRVASQRWRAEFSTTWTVLSAFALGGVAMLDTGIDSPLIVLLFLPIGFSALAFTPRASAVCGISCLASAGIVTITDSGGRLSAEGALMLFAALAGAAVLAFAAARNRTRRERHEQALAEEIGRLAYVDGLTGCAVHRVFHERLAQEIARSVRHHQPLSLMIIDVDRFKGVNDTYGHLVGDNVLAGTGAALIAHSRSSDLVGRIGGDEFAVLMPNTQPTAALALAQRVRRELPRSLEVPVTFSVGVSGLDSSNPTPEQMIDDADFALYEVKGAGRDGVIVRNPSGATSRSRPNQR